MAKNNGTTKRVTRKRPAATAPKTARKPRLSEEAIAELQGAKVEEVAAAAEVVVESPAPAVAAAAPEPTAAEAAPAASAVAGELEVVEPAPVAEDVPVGDVEVLEVAPPRVADVSEIRVAPAPPPPRAVSVFPPPPAEASARLETTRRDRRFRRIAFVRAMLHRLRHEAEVRSAPLVRRVAARFPRLVRLSESIRRWL